MAVDLQPPSQLQDTGVKREKENIEHTEKQEKVEQEEDEDDAEAGDLERPESVVRNLTDSFNIKNSSSKSLDEAPVIQNKKGSNEDALSRSKVGNSGDLPPKLAAQSSIQPRTEESGVNDGIQIDQQSEKEYNNRGDNIERDRGHTQSTVTPASAKLPAPSTLNAPTPATHESSSIFESDSESESENPVVNKSSFGFTGLPKKEPVIKKSFAKTPSTSVSASRTEQSMVSRLQKDPSSFEAKIAASAAANHTSDNNNIDHKTPIARPAESRVSVHYPKIESTPLDKETPRPKHYGLDVELTPPSAFTDKIKSVSPSRDANTDDEAYRSAASTTSKKDQPRGRTLERVTSNGSTKARQNLEKSETSTEKAPTKQGSPERPVRVASSKELKESPKKWTDSKKLKESPTKKNDSNDSKESPKKSDSKKSTESPKKSGPKQKNISPEKPQDSPDKTPSKYEGGLFALANGVFRSARSMFVKEKQEESEVEEPKPMSTTTKKNQQDTINRLMAPTYASSTRSNRPQSPTRDLNASPLAEKKPIYPELPKSISKQQPKLGAPSATPQSKTARDIASELAKKSESGTNSTAVKKTEASGASSTNSGTTVKKVAKKPEPSSLESWGTNSSTGPKVVSKPKLTKQPLQAKKTTSASSATTASSSSSTNTTSTTAATTTSSNSSKPLHVKIPTAANQADKKPSRVSNSGSNSSLTSSALPVKTQVKKLESANNSKSHAGANKKPEVKTLKRNFQLETESRQQQHQQKAATRPQAKEVAASSASAQSAQKRTSEQAMIAGSPLEKKATRVSQLSKPGYKKPVTTTPAASSSSSSSNTAGSSSLMKTAVMQQAKSAAAIPPVEGVKFSNDSIRFASISSSGSSSGGSVNNPAAQTAAPSSQQPQQPKQPQKPPANPFRQLPTVSQMHQQQQSALQTPKTNGDNVVLPDIMSESEDDDDGSVLQDWANSPELRNMLLEQEKVNPDAVFGPIAPLHMDEIFRSSRLSRFRPRSSSANWNNQDRLTAEEVEQYAAKMGYR